MPFPRPFSFRSNSDSLSTVESMDAKTTTPADSDSVEPMETRTTTPVASEMLLRPQLPGLDTAFQSWSSLPQDFSPNPPSPPPDESRSFFPKPTSSPVRSPSFAPTPDVDQSAPKPNQLLPMLNEKKKDDFGEAKDDPLSITAADASRSLFPKSTSSTSPTPKLTLTPKFTSSPDVDPDSIPNQYLSIFPEQKVEEVRKASTGTFVFESQPEPYLTFSQAQLIYEKLAKEKQAQARQGTPSRPALLEKRRSSGALRKEQSFSQLQAAKPPTPAFEEKAHRVTFSTAFPDQQNEDLPWQLPVTLQLPNDLPLRLPPESHGELTVKVPVKLSDADLQRVLSDGVLHPDNSRRSNLSIRESDHSSINAKEDLLRLLLKNDRFSDHDDSDSEFFPSQDRNSSLFQRPGSEYFPDREDEDLILENILQLLLHRNISRKNSADLLSASLSAPQDSIVRRRDDTTWRDPDSPELFEASLLDAQHQRDSVKMWSVENKPANGKDNFPRREDVSSSSFAEHLFGVEKQQRNPVFAKREPRFGEVGRSRSRFSSLHEGRKKGSNIAAAVSHMLENEPSLLIGGPSQTSALAKPTRPTEIYKGMGAEETMEVLMQRLQNKMRSEDIVPQDIPDLTAMQLFELNPEEYGTVINNLTSSVRAGRKSFYAGMDTQSLLPVFLNQLHEEISRDSTESLRDFTSRVSTSSEEPVHIIKKTKILVLKQPDPDRQTDLHSIAVVFLEEAYSISDDVRVYYPPLQECRFGGAMCYHNGYVYVLGGVYEGVASTRAAKINIFDARPQWVNIEPMPHSRRLHAAVVFGDYIFVYGGLNKTDSTGWTGDVYYTETNKWSSRSGMRRARKEFAMVQCRNFVCALGGSSGRNKPVKIVERYEKRGNLWKPINVLNQNRVRCAAVTIGDLVYVIGGKATEFTICVSKLGRSHWREIYRSPRPRWNHSACVLDRKIYILGGFYSSRDEPANEINRFDPFTRLWETVGEAKGVYMNSCVTVESQLS